MKKYIVTVHYKNKSIEILSVKAKNSDALENTVDHAIKVWDAINEIEWYDYDQVKFSKYLDLIYGKDGHVGGDIVKERIKDR